METCFVLSREIFVLILSGPYPAIPIAQNFVVPVQWNFYDYGYGYC